jgi:glyceraldehyde 3-phosphate dehydrogenase
MRIAINGMGRIGRLLCKLLTSTTHDIVAVNDPMSAKNLAYLLKYDSVYGTEFGKSNEVEEAERGIRINRKLIDVYQETEPLRIPWHRHSPDVVIECSGRFNSRESLRQHIEAGAGKVLLSTTGDLDIPVVIRGFNDVNLPHDNILASGGCMTNCTVPVLHILNTHYGIESVHIGVTHSYTSRQSLTDAAAVDFRRGRAAGTSIIPVNNDLSKALEMFFPVIAGKVTTSSTRVPVECGAFVDFCAVLKTAPAVEEMNGMFDAYAGGEMNGILEVTRDPVVSRDILRNPHSAVVDATLTKATGTHVKVSAWFDDQFAFVNRLVEILEMIGRMRQV